jgi:UDP-N-acetylmuramyl-tripeptide synthetase
VKLSKLLEDVEVISGGDPETNNRVTADPEIASVHYRAQDVSKGGLFVAIPGFVSDGHDFIDTAAANGAYAILTEKPVKTALRVIRVESTRRALASISSRFYKDPSKRLVLIGVTGTNGKTTVTYLIESILDHAGKRAGVIGTINYRYGGRTFDNPVTTPESLDLQRIMSEMIDEGVTHAVMEVSSHAIDLFRVESCRFDVGVFTNLSQDHLDFHKNMDAYWASKKRLFTENLSGPYKKNRARAVINCDDQRGRALSECLSIPVMTVGRTPASRITPSGVTHDRTGIAGRVSTPAGAFDFASPLVGEHNLENILCAAGVGAALDLPLSAVKAGIESLSFVPGRLEPVPNIAGRYVYVDYAHTPDALKGVLSSLGKMTARRMICVFGCGGDRDRDKRPKMGAIAARLCDLSVITSDNPRTEPPETIIEQIHQGFPNAGLEAYSPADLIRGFNGKGYVIEPDRKKAIRLAITASRPGDTVLIAGKGHETYQILGDRKIAFDDRREAISVLDELEGAR